MRLWILSDLHLEVQPEVALGFPDADVAVVAGDVSRPLWTAVQWLADTIAPHLPVVYVAGNHEFYGTSHAGGLRRGLSAAAAVKGVHLLQDSAVTIGEVRFVGGTLWTDYALQATSHSGRPREMDIAYAMHHAGSLLVDHAAIALDESQADRFRPEDARTAHLRTRAYLEGVLADGFSGPTVVVSHHAPHLGSIEERYRGAPLTPSFASDLSELIRGTQPAMWIHGHVHHTTMYRVGSTLVACNPRGYPGENPDWNPGLIVSVPRSRSC